MKSNEYTTKVTVWKTIDEGDGWATYKMTIENVDSKATVLLNKKDLRNIVAEITTCLADIDDKEGEGND